MKYEYMGIKLGDSIEKIINFMNVKNTTYRRFYNYLVYTPETKIEDLKTTIHIYIYTSTIVLMLIHDENYYPVEELKIGTKMNEELKRKYRLVKEDEEAAEEGYYESKKYEKLGLIIDFGNGRLKRFKDEQERIIGYIFDGQKEITLNFEKDNINNFLACKNLQDIYYSLKNSKTLDVNIEKREIYGQLDNYKFTFDLVTRDIKTIQNLKTGELIKNN